MDLLLEKIVSQAMEKEEKVWNPYDIIDDTTILYYWDKKYKIIREFLIDTEDFDRVKNYYWSVVNNGYPHVKTATGGKKIWLHNFIMSYNRENPNFVIDHIDRNPFNNKKENLRLVHYSLNQWNQEKGDNTGIYKRGNKWKVTGSRILSQECLVDSYEGAIKKRKEYIKEFEEYLKKNNEGSTTIP